MILNFTEEQVMIAINGIVVTEEMRAAGEQMANDCMDAHLSHAFGNSRLGGCAELDWNDYPTNRDLIQKYIEKEITSVEAIYIAMRRSRK